jgi:hypothetical protein
MNVNLHIERLVIEGAAAGGPGAIRKAVEAELTRLVAREGISPAFLTGGAMASLSPVNLQPGEMGTGIARAVHSVLKEPDRR